MRHSLPFLLALALVASMGLAQELDPDAEGCSDSPLLQRMPGCTIYSCESADYDEATFETGPWDDEAGEVPRTTVEGKKVVVDYYCPGKYSVLQLARNAEGALKKAGYTIVFSGKNYGNGNPGLVARKGSQWIGIETHEVAGDVNEYIVTTLKTEEMEQLMEADAGVWADAIRATGRVAIHDITFDTGKATLRPECDPILNEVMILMRNNPDWKLRIEGHTDDVGDAAANHKLSHERAAAVVTWLTLHGVDASRLTAVGHGESKPLVANDSEENRAKNRRVELVKI